MRYEKLIIYVQSHANAVSLLKSEEQCYIKAINNNNQTVARKHGFNIMQEKNKRVMTSNENLPAGGHFRQYTL